MRSGEVARSPIQGKTAKGDMFTPPPYKPSKGRPTISTNTVRYSEESDDGSDDEVAMHTHKSAKTQLATPTFTSSTYHRIVPQHHSRKTPGANRMEPFKSGAFAAVPILNASAEVKSQTAGPNGSGTSLMAFGSEVSHARGMPLPPRHKNQPRGDYHAVQTPEQRNVSGTDGYRNNVNTPIDAMLRKNTNLNLQGRGESPSTELLRSNLHFLDEDDATPSRDQASLKNQVMPSISQASSFGDESLGSRSEPRGKFNEQVSPNSKATRKSSDVGSVHSYNSVASESSKADGVCSFSKEITSRDVKHLSPTRVQQQNGGLRSNHVAQNPSYQQTNAREEYIDHDFPRGQGDSAYYPYNQPAFEQQDAHFHPNDVHFVNQGPQIQHIMHYSPITIPIMHNTHNPSPLTIPSYAVAGPMIFPNRESPVPFHQGWPGMDMHGQQNLSQWTDMHGNTGVGSGWNQHHPSQPVQQQHPHSFGHYPQHQGGHWVPQEYNDYGSGTVLQKQVEHAQGPYFDNSQSGNRFNSNGQHHIQKQVNNIGQSQSSLKYPVVSDGGPKGKGLRLGKQNKQKGLSDCSTKHINRDISDQMKAQTLGKSQRGKKGNRKNSAVEGDDTKELTEVEQAAEEKRAELIETPAVRILMKNFYRKFRLQEKESLEGAEEYAEVCLANPHFEPSVHWRIYLELADLSKRSNKLNRARNLYSKVCTLQPYASQGWLERSKLEEKCGKLECCSKILCDGLRYCPANENLRTRAIKHEERMAYESHDGDLSRARKLLEPTASMDIEKVWRTRLEGALMEARGGNIDIARSELKKLMKSVSWYGPLYLEAFRLERDCDLPERALHIVNDGLKEIPRYGPLWFGALRICEGIDIQNGDLHLPRTFDYIDRAIKSISRELIWKVQMEAAQALERAAHISISKDSNQCLSDLLTETRKRFTKTIFFCPENLCWKAWLAEGRMELSAGRFDEARQLFLKSFSVVPTKGRPSVLLECVRLEEFVGNIDVAKAILCKTRTEAKADWKVWLQSVSMEVRSGNRKLAISLAQKGLSEHSGTGRLWATLVQLHQDDGEEQQMKVLEEALHAVPKSGEVWCEAARIYLNPFSPLFDVGVSSTYLDFATKFTPQYGDSFLEALRHEMVKAITNASTDVHGVATALQDCPEENILSRIIELFNDSVTTLITNKQSTNEVDKVIGELDTTKLELRCSNADPDYGKLWFYSRSKPSDTARKVLEQAKQVIWNDLRGYSFIYIFASMRQESIKFCSKSNIKVNVPSLTDLLNGTKLKEDCLLKGISMADFVTGFIEVNGEVNLQSLSLFDRRKFLFGSDLLLTWKPLN
jgi:la-related protein 1